MKKHLLSLLMLLLLPIMAIAADTLDYEIVGEEAGIQGTYIVKVTVHSKKSKISDDLIARCAVHGVLFKGYLNIRPLAGSASVEAQHADFFSTFFAEKGDAKNYVSTVSSSRTVVKENKVYKISTIVTVSKDQLRKDLEKAGVLKGLNSAF
jgi:hypothetical protein